MPRMPYVIALGLAAIAGAVVVTGLLLTRSDAPVRVEFAELDYGGVMLVRTEVYQRHGAKAELIAGRFDDGQFGVFPERYVTEAWALLAPRGAVEETATATWTETSEVVERSRRTLEGTVHERPALGVTDREPPSDTRLLLGVMPSELQNQSRQEYHERIDLLGWVSLDGAAGTLRIAATFPVDPDGLIGPDDDGFIVPYFGDLPVAEVVRELIYRSDYTPLGEERYVILDDGSRILVESRRTTLEVRTIAEWEAFVASVWGE